MIFYLKRFRFQATPASLIILPRNKAVLTLAQRKIYFEKDSISFLFSLVSSDGVFHLQ